MSTLTFSVDKDIFEKHPGFRRAVIIARGVTNEGDLSETINEQLAFIKSLASDDPRLLAWREAFAAEGIKVRDFRPSIDALVKRIQADKPFGSINAIVDVGTIVSLKYVLPAGAHPILPDTEEMHLGRADGSEIDTTLDGKTELVPKGEIVLKDTGRLAARRWVWRQTPLSRIDGSTTDFSLNIDALSETDDQTLEDAMRFSQKLIEAIFGVKTVAVVLDESDPTMVISELN